MRFFLSLFSRKKDNLNSCLSGGRRFLPYFPSSNQGKVDRACCQDLSLYSAHLRLKGLRQHQMFACFAV